MKTTQGLLPVDLSLTPQNAKERGYVWVGDIVSESNAFLVGFQEDVSVLLREGYILGRAQYETTSSDKGLYCPVSSSPEQRHKKKVI